MAENRKRQRLWRYWPRFLLIIPFALVAWVPFYNRIEPTLAGVPFFYWYQLAAILLGAAVIVTVYRLERAGMRGGDADGNDGERTAVPERRP